MDAEKTSEQKISLHSQVLASPAYQERCEPLFDLFRLSREASKDPKAILIIQMGLAEVLMQFQSKMTEFKQTGNHLGVAVAKRLTLITKQIADSLAWRVLGFDRILVQLLAEHAKTGALDNSLAGDFSVAQNIVEEQDAIVLVNDLTSILRHGDLTIIGEGDITLVETKYGRASKRNRRAKRQRTRMEELLGFLNTGVRIRKGRRDLIIRADVPVTTYHSAVAEVISQARKRGYHRVDVSDALVVEGVWMKSEGNPSPHERPFAGVEHVIQFHNLWSFDRPTPRTAPYGIFPLDHQSCYALITGEILLTATLNFDQLQVLYGRYGLQLDVPRPSKEIMQAYLTASVAERKRLNVGSFTIRSPNCELRLMPDLFGRIGLEFIQEETILQADRQLVNLVEAQGITYETPTRFYIGYKDESGIWV
ncbi:MAG: hypothetical protein JXM73_07790 [Anaerolineae bacterium]|nr:hypothetical protein [Anaerolineae bacterium]